MSRKIALDRVAAHYDAADTSRELEDATAVRRLDVPPTAERMSTFAVRLPVVVLDHIRAVAAQRNLTTSALIRHWIDAGLAEDDSDAGTRAVPVQALLELIGRAPRGSAGR